MDEPVKTFVPVLALRDAREALRDQGVDVVSPQQMDSAASVAPSSRPASARDVLLLDDRDALSIGDDMMTL